MKVGFDGVMNRGRNIWRILPVFILLSLVLTGCGKPYLSALDPKGIVAEKQLSLIMLTLYVMIFVFIVVLAIYTYVIIRFRERPGQENVIPKQVEGNHKLEIIWTVIPIILLIIIAVPMIQLTFGLSEEYSAEEHPDAVVVNVSAHQFWWEFEYPDLGIVTAQELYIPVGEKVFFNLTANDVIHSFWVPALGGKMDTNPGLVNSKYLEASEPGTYQGRCAELCGASHALMDFLVVAVSPEEFDQWVAEMTEPQLPEPSTDVALQGRDLFVQNCLICHAVAGEGTPTYPNLTNIADRQLLAGFLENNEENLREWIRNPQEFKPGNIMLNAEQLNLSDDDITAIVEYMKTLTVKESY